MFPVSSGDYFELIKWIYFKFNLKKKGGLQLLLASALWKEIHMYVYIYQQTKACVIKK